jgi:hypothetical protein
MAKSTKKSASNALGTDQSLQHFDLIELQQYTKEKIYSTDASKDFHLFYVGRDDVHDILKYVLSRVTVSLYLNMYGYDDDELNPTAYNTHFVVGTSATGQISHTKGFVADGKVAAEGSTNWSTSGEGTFIITGQPGGPGYKAQNNTQSVITDPDSISRFTAELISEHMAAQSFAKAQPKSQQKVPIGTPPKFGGK